MARIIRKIIGVPCVMMGIFFLIIMILVPFAFGGGHEATWEDLNWPAVLLLVALQLVSMTVGVILLRWEHYSQRWQEHLSEKERMAAESRYTIAAEAKKERNSIQEAKKRDALQRAKEAYQKEQLAKQREEEELALARQREEEEQQKLLDLPRFPGSQRVTLYCNRHPGVENYIGCALFLGMALGALLAIPLIVEWCEGQELLLATAGLTIVFLIGFIGIIHKWVLCKKNTVEAYAITSEEILYCVTFAPIRHQSRAVTKLGTAIENYKYLSTFSELHDKQMEFLRSDAAVAAVEQVINEGSNLPFRGSVIRLNSPSVLKRGIFGAKLRYWNEEAKCWKKIKLLRSNDGHDTICQVIQKKRDWHKADIRY